MKKSIANLFLLAVMGTACAPVPNVGIDNLTVEMKQNPLGVSVVQPRFSWRIDSKNNGLMQTSYQIEVATSEKDLKEGKNLVWDSGVVESDQSLLIPYGGPALSSMNKYYWRVKLNTTQGETQWSKPQLWSMAMLDSSDFKAKWIGEDKASNEGEVLEGGSTRLAARYLRKQFDTQKKQIKDATLYISGLGSNIAYINGKRVSDDVFVPVVSDYNKTVYYNVYDVKDLLAKGGNTIGVELGNGRYFSMIIPGFKSYGIPTLYAQLEIEYADGEKETIISDESWKVTSKGPIVANNEFMGEEYDANLEMPGWNKNGFDDSSWQAVDLMSGPRGSLAAQQTLPIRIQDTVTPISIVRRSDGAYILDMGQNMVGWLDVNLIGRKDSTISMRFAEILNPDTTLYVANLRRAKACDTYKASKDGKFSWEPNFVYHGFRFVEVTGLDYEPSLKDFTGKVVYDQMPTTGKFESSNALVNKIHENAFWGIRGNYRGMPTDCPQRDERLGWLGDRATGCYGESYIFNNANLYSKWLNDIEDGMDAEGRIPSVAPTQWTILPGDVTWPSAFYYAADMLNKKFGEDKPIKTHYQAMKRGIEFFKNNTMENYIVMKDQYGDWCMPPESKELIHSKDPSRVTAGPVLSTTVFYDLLNKMQEFAVIAGYPEDTAEYAELAAKVKEAYNKKYFDAEKGCYDNNTVTANILSLRLGLVPEGYEDKVVENIIAKTNGDFGGHVSTGVLGIQHLMRGLTETGHLDLAYKILTNETYPSWGYMVNNGATTIWELWNGNTADPAMNSANHVMLLGDLIIWYYENLAGIKNAPGSRAFKDIVIEPVYPDGLDFVEASFDSPYGPIKSYWVKKDGKLTLDVTIPGNTTATVRLPKTEGFEKLAETVPSTPGVINVVSTPTAVEVEVGSGKYSFAE